MKGFHGFSKGKKLIFNITIHVADLWKHYGSLSITQENLVIFSE